MVYVYGSIVGDATCFSFASPICYYNPASTLLLDFEFVRTIYSYFIASDSELPVSLSTGQIGVFLSLLRRFPFSFCFCLATQDNAQKTTATKGHMNTTKTRLFAIIYKHHGIFQ
jgi:hypothetical protein